MQLPDKLLQNPLQRSKTSYVNYNKSLNVLLNTTGPLDSFDDVTNPSLVSAMRFSLATVQNESIIVLSLIEDITRDISSIRANSSLILTPEVLSNSIDRNVTKKVTNALIGIRKSFGYFLNTVQDVGRLVMARGSIYDLLSPSSSQNIQTTNNALKNFQNQYTKVRNSLLSSVNSYKASTSSEINKFITRVQSTYNDAIIRSNFDEFQYPLIKRFSDVVSSRIFNSTFFQISFDNMRDLIEDSFTNTSTTTSSIGSKHLKAILDLQRFSYVRHYSECLNELVSAAQEASSSTSSGQSLCLNERTSGIAVAIPSTTIRLGAIKETVNFIVQQFNQCLNSQTSIAARTAISDCIQIVS